MRISEHLVKAESIENSMRKLNPAEDYEMFIECGALVLTHYMNCALHHENVMDELIDQVHTFRPVLSTYAHQPSRYLMEGVALLDYIEKLRPVHCRGNVPLTQTQIQNCIDNYIKCKELFFSIIGNNYKKDFWQ